MDKIYKLHKKVFDNPEQTPAGHASITEDMMGKFAEWMAKENWGYDGQGAYMRNERKPSEYRNKFVCKTTPELIQLFKLTL